ncbi:Flp family type IVb pilin [Sphingomonas floccifaciens]|uniref:Flp family type IVb pilin n=1 Tax=Sphingomonas floccifaciens TaxID=1844115 RepID=A0ABW4NGN1_9SPHN
MVHDPIRTATRLLARLMSDRKAATAVEYGLIIAMIVLAMMTALLSLGDNTQTMWTSIRTKITNATGY